MSQREKFEAWFSDNGQHPKAVERSGDGYKLASANAAWTAWQVAWPASRHSALEDAAKVCEHHYDKGRPDFTRDPYITTLQCAAAIRAIAKETNNE